MTEEEQLQLGDELEDEELRSHRQLRSGWNITVSVVALVYALYQLYIIYFPPTTIELRIVHLAFALVLIFALVPITKTLTSQTSIPWYDWIFIAASITAAAYVAVESHALSQERLGFYNSNDIIVSILIIILVLEATRRILGMVLPIIAIVFLAYAYFGYLIPGDLGTRQFDIDRIATHLSLWTEGILGTALGATASFVMLFVIFAAFLQRSGVGQFFIDLAMGIFGKYRGGPAKVAVVASSLMGTVSGSAVANVAGTGPLTIPLIRRIGFRREEAGAVEAVASSGGQLVPPIMGAGAFVMADIIGISYFEIVVAAIIPAVLYYASVFLSVDTSAAQNDLRGLTTVQAPSIKTTLAKGWHLMLPLVLLVYLMTAGGASPGFAVFWSIPACVVVSWFRVETRMGPKSISETLIAGSKSALSVVAVCACAGIIIGVFSLTGLGLTLSGTLVNLAGGSLMLLAVLTMIACLIAGMGLPTVAAYIVVAVLVAPALTSLGVPVLQAHLFVFYFAILSAITPPVALASYVAAGIAGGAPMRTSFEGLRMALGGLLVPFLFLMNSELIGRGSALGVAGSIISAVVGIGLIIFGAYGYAYFIGKIGIVLRIVFLAAGLALMVPTSITNLIGVTVFGAALLWWMQNKVRNSTQVVTK